jgi:hypothetical protein
LDSSAIEPVTDRKAVEGYREGGACELQDASPRRWDGEGSFLPDIYTELQYNPGYDDRFYPAVKYCYKEDIVVTFGRRHTNS